MSQDFSNTRHAVLDIEGTLCPISFVKETLFPYAIKALPGVVRSKWDSPDFEKYKSAFPKECQETPENFIEHVKDLTERNVKIAYFKDLQGYLWEDGYKSGAYSAPFFEDVVPALERWKQDGVGISIYSSGSVFAQKLLFGHVNVNKTEDSRATLDLQPLVSEWFDTVNVGLKLESTSYDKISGLLEVPPTQILFLSDNITELEAAKKAGFKVALVVRPGNDEVPDDKKREFQILKSFDGVALGQGNAQKKQEKQAPDVNEETMTEQANGRFSHNRPADKNEGKDPEAVEAEAERGPAKKKQKTGKGKAMPEKSQSQRRSHRLQQSN
ncbi:hypothetical protein DV736_g1694, partial [Chaetothyriales sp. CBS 134916]